MSNASNSEDEINKVGNEDFEDIQENDNEDDRINTEDDMSNASNSEDEDDEVDNENPSTTSLLGTDIEENEEDLSDSEGNIFDAARSEDENDVDSKVLMEGNTSGENTFAFSMGSADRADTGDNPLYPGAPLSKGESVLMLMSYLLRLSNYFKNMVSVLMKKLEP
ncbi:serine/threonine-protein kinase rio2-like [Esox lucius]|uniref:serine/threonine-protein kinase rio2-like n=1 Tax=Esox lucius TaxID=8010 RepID=UPI0010BD3731|nr:serine/threonine-protein kinase rio2-like [Esox lucius]